MVNPVRVVMIRLQAFLIHVRICLSLSERSRKGAGTGTLHRLRMPPTAHRFTMNRADAAAVAAEWAAVAAVEAAEWAAAA